MVNLTAESVTEGHPDKIADQISDALLDAFIAIDSSARVACETVVTSGFVLVTGEISTMGYVEIEKIVRATIRSLGYTKAEYGFAAESCGIISAIHQQSVDIAVGVNRGGAGDQGVMVGYATAETEEFMPATHVYAHRLTRSLAKARKEGSLPYLRPDGKAQVSIDYQNGQLVRISNLILSAQHDPGISLAKLRNDLLQKVIRPALPSPLLDAKTKFHINPTGQFVSGGPQADSGLTGRKIIVDSYGPTVPHGGGAFSGKDPTKVDRSGAYMARYLAKNIVASGLANECLIQISYAIGVAEPISLAIDTRGSSKIADIQLTRFVRKIIDLTPIGIIDRFDLRRPIYRQTAAYGHFGRNDLELPWERVDLAPLIQKSLG